MGIETVVRLGETAREISTDTFARPITSGLLLQMRGGDFTMSQVIPATETRQLILSFMDAYNHMYQQDKLFNSALLAQFSRHIAVDLAEMAMHERIVARCTPNVGRGMEELLTEFISSAEKLAEDCDQIISVSRSVHPS